MHDNIRQHLQTTKYAMPDQWSVAGSLIKTLAGSVAHHDVLVLGESMATIVPDFLKGLNITSQLIHAMEDSTLHQLLKITYKSDIRLTAHCQPYSEFLTDIKHHRFDMIVASTEQKFLPQILTLLMDNALLCYFSTTPIQHAVTDTETWNSALLLDNHLALINRAKIKPKRRRKQ